MNLWVKEISSNPIQEVNNFLQRYDEKYHTQLLNGNWKSIESFFPIHYLLFHNPFKHKEVIYYLIEKGVNLNLKSKKGVNFFHLFIILFFHLESFQTDNVVDLFIELLHFGFEENNIIIFSTENVYTILDLLYELQNSCIIPSTFFSKEQIVSKKLNYCKLPISLFDKLYITLLCHGCKFYRVSSYYHSNTISIFTISDYIKKYPILKYFLIEQYKLPFGISNKEIEKRILFLHLNKKSVIRYFNNSLSNDNIPIQTKSNFQNLTDKKDDITFLNPDFVENFKLSQSEFLSCYNNNCFHKRFFPLLYQTKIDPYTRRKIPNDQLEIWKNEMKFQYIFPITTLDEDSCFHKYIFHPIRITQYGFIEKAIVSYLESYFNINHPYHHISKIMYLKKYEIQYFSHVFSHETSFFKKFKLVLEKPTKKILLKVIFFYCKLNSKYVNILYFIMEEIFQDLKCYEKLKSMIEDIENHSIDILHQYTGRFGTENPIYINKFLENMNIIHKFYKQ